MGGALKNVLAIACGISDGLGFGNNARAALITRGLVEITRLAVASGAHPMTMGGLAGMGDLVLTCTGVHLHFPMHSFQEPSSRLLSSDAFSRQNPSSSLPLQFRFKSVHASTCCEQRLPAVVASC